MQCASTLLLLCATERVPRPLPMLTSFTLLVPRSYTVDGDNLSPSADTVLLDNSYLPAAFATDFGSAPWTLDKGGPLHSLGPSGFSAEMARWSLCSLAPHRGTGCRGGGRGRR